MKRTIRVTIATSLRVTLTSSIQGFFTENLPYSKPFSQAGIGIAEDFVEAPERTKYTKPSFLLGIEQTLSHSAKLRCPRREKRTYIQSETRGEDDISPIVIIPRIVIESLIELKDCIYAYSRDRER